MTGPRASRRRAAQGRGGLVALYAATAISLGGNQLTAIAIPWLVLTTLGTPLEAGVVGAAIVLPGVIGALAGGVIVDRLGSRETSILADVASALTVAAVPVLASTVGLTIPALVVLAFAGALLDAPGATARQVLLPSLAARSGMELERANAGLQAIENATLMLGPILAGIVIVVIGPIDALWIDAASFVVSAGIVAVGVPSVAKGEGEQVADVLAGIRLLLRDRLLRSLTFVAAVANLVGTPVFVVLLPAYASTLGLGAGTLGLLLGAFGAGMVAGSVGFGIAGSRLGRQRLVAVGLAGTGLALAIVALGPPLPVVVAALLLGGLATGPVNPIAFTVMQERVPPEVRGRVFGAVLGGVLVASPIGMVVLGAVTANQGPAIGLGVAGVVFVAIGMLVAASPVFAAMDTRPGGAVAEG